LRKSLHLSVAALAIVILSGSALAQTTPPTTTFYLDDPGPTGANLAGVYTSPYLGQVNYPTSAIVPVICDDFADESFVPEEWTAFVTSLSQVESGSYGTPDNYLKFGDTTSNPSTSGLVLGSDSVTGSWSLTQDQAYDAAAILAIDILNSSGTTQQYYSFAMWALFESSSAIGDLNEYSVNPTIVEQYLNTAIGDVTNPNATIDGETVSAYLSGYNVTIYSYDTGATCPGQAGGVCASTPPQEFITVTAPEASTPVLLAVDLLGFIALMGFLRKRMSATV